MTQPYVDREGFSFPVRLAETWVREHDENQEKHTHMLARRVFRTWVRFPSLMVVSPGLGRRRAG